MRRLWFLVLPLVLLAGCADLASLLPDREESTLPSAFVAPTPESVYPPEMSTAARILSRGILVVGVRYDLEPFSYVTESSELAGLEVDLAHELARRWLGDAGAVQFRQVRSDTAFDHLDRGTVDVVLGGIVHTQDIETRVDFSPPYFMDGLALLTFPDAGIQGLGDVQGRKIGIVPWTGSQALIEPRLTVSTTLVTYDTFFEVVEALRLRQIDAYGDQRHRLERARRMVAGSAVLGQVTWDAMSMIYRQDDPFFNNLVQLTFQDMAADGTRDSLYARWLPATSPPSVIPLPGDAATPALSDSPSQISSVDVISRIRARGSLAVGYFVDRWPYTADRADGVPTGFEVRLAERFAERWLGTRASVVFVPVMETDAAQRLAEGQIDILMGGQPKTRDAELQMDFSITLFDDGVGILSLASAPVQLLADLRGRPVGVVVGSAGEKSVPLLTQGLGLSAMGYPTFDDALTALQGGEVVALLTERQPALDVYFHREGFYFPDDRYTYRPVAWAVPEGDSAFRDLVDLTFMEFQATGGYQELYGLWFDDAIPILETRSGQPAVALVIGP